MKELTLEKFEEAAEIVKNVTLETKLVYSEYFLSLIHILSTAKTVE